jgi:thioredoxin-related protein
MKPLIFTLFVIFSMAIFVDGQTPNWQAWNAGYEKAKNENKILMIFIQREGCPYCKKMDKETFVDKAVLSLLGKNFISVRFNPEIADSIFKLNGKEYTPTQFYNYLSDNSLLDENPRIAYPTTVFYYPENEARFFETGVIAPKVFKAILVNSVKSKGKIK